MCRQYAAVLALLFACTGAAQERQIIPVSVSRAGKDQVGLLFLAALNRELSHSLRHGPMPANPTNKGLRFYIELVTVDVAENEQQRGNRSAVSVVIEEMGLPNSFPVPNKWYHKAFVVDQNTVDKTAKELIEDMDARWCRYPKNSIGGCPKEKLEPTM
jgi:hypothetical protein